MSSVRKLLILLTLSPFLIGPMLGTAMPSPVPQSDVEPLFVHAEGPSLAPLLNRPEVLLEGTIHVRTDLLLDAAEHKTGRFSFELFYGVPQIVVFKDSLQSVTGGWVWSGTLEGPEGGTLTIAVHGDSAAGSIRIGSSTYVIEPAQPSQPSQATAAPHRLLEIDASALSGCGVDESHRVMQQSDAAPPQNSMAGPLTANILVGFTPEVTGTLGLSGALASIDAAVFNITAGLANSEVPVVFNLVGAVETVEGEGTSGMQVTLTRLQAPNDGWYDELHPLRDSLAADFVALYIDNDPLYCGMAFIMGTVDPLFESSAFSVTVHSCDPSNLVLAHELGHNMGCAHDRSNAPVWPALGSGAYPYSYGYQTASNPQFRTIMAYPPGSIIPYFSNPDLSYQGSAIGLPESSPNAADNSRSIEETASVFSFFRITDCNDNGTEDQYDIKDGTSLDCDLNGIPDECEIVGNDCNSNGTLDICDISDGSPDCNGNWLPDECDLASDCNANAVPDECEADCDRNGMVDECDIMSGASDCNENLILDECEEDCNSNSVPDDCDVATQTSLDCNLNVVPDECDIASNLSSDCNQNLAPDECDIAIGFSLDCNLNGLPDDCDIGLMISADCNGNLVPDECDIANGAADCNANVALDECEPDCDLNGVADECDITNGSPDCNGNLLMDDCEPDCNLNGLPDECDIAEEASGDCNSDMVPDECEPDCDASGVPDECEALRDCDNDGIPDACAFELFGLEDCNENGIPDLCDIALHIESDDNGNGVPDVCQPVDSDETEETVSYCFVATAAYGDYDAPEVKVLRRWRDESLAHSRLGETFIETYYRHSPPLAAAISERPWARLASRVALAPVVGIVWLRLEAPWSFPAGIGLLLLLGAFGRSRPPRQE